MIRNSYKTKVCGYWRPLRVTGFIALGFGVRVRERVRVRVGNLYPMSFRALRQTVSLAVFFV